MKMNDNIIISICYIVSMGICGLVLVCISSTLGNLAINVGLNCSTELGSVFIARGIGSIFGAAVSSSIFKNFDGNYVLCFTLFLILTLLLIIPFNTSLSFIHIIFFLMGLGTSITDTGCQIMTRKLHGKDAGPWLGANTVAFGASAVFVPIIEIISKNLWHQYLIMAGFVSIVLSLLTLESYRINTNKYKQYNNIDGEFVDSFDDVEKQYRLAHITAPEAHFDHVYKYHVILEEKKKEQEAKKMVDALIGGDYNGTKSYDDNPNEIALKLNNSTSTSSIHSKLVSNHEDLIPHYHCEICASIMVFWLVGGNVSLTAYLDSYLAETNVIEVNNIPKLILVLWIAITLGRLLGVKDQMDLTENNLILHFASLCITGCMAVALIMSLPQNGTILWCSIAIFGVCNGPTVGYCYDLINRLTYPTEKSMSIVMFGLNCGASLVPYITTWLWHIQGPKALIHIEFFSSFIPFPLIFLTSYLRYEQKKSHIQRITYKSLEMIDIRQLSVSNEDIPLD
jgi:predicted MFS family arabinose efflux permease